MKAKSLFLSLFEEKAVDLTEIKAVALVLNMSVYWHHSHSTGRLLEMIDYHMKKKITFLYQFSGAEKHKAGLNDLKEIFPHLLVN